jgi:anti-sigma regulatory factor (Ser/Thr protein kinase)
MGLFWAVPVGMLSVSRLLINIGVGEEDRNSLKSVMHFMFTGYLALQSIISLGIISLSIPFTRIFYQNPVEPVYMMTAWGFRILPLCMPLSIICMHFIAYAQATDKHVLLNLLAVFDGVLGVAITAPLLIGRFGINAIYIANVLNGVITTLIIFLYAFMINRHVPRNIGELMVIPEDFGVPDDAVVVIEVKNMEHVVEVAKNVQHFCEERGIDRKRAMLAGLSLEEMAGNVVTHGFSMDDRKHTVIVKAIHRNNDVILTIKDDCLAFDPAARNDINDLEDPTRYIGIRMIFKIASEVNYQNVLGLNFLTIRI